MRILLIHPPRSPFALAPRNLEPLALEVLAATVPGHEVSVVDMRFEPSGALRQTLRSLEPRLVGVTANNTVDVGAVRRLIREVGEVLPGCSVVVGGHHATMAPEDFYLPEVDALFRGWADVSFPAYVRCLESGGDASAVPGVQLLAGGVLVDGEPRVAAVRPEDVPLPDRSSTQRYRGRYRDEIGRTAYLVNTVRGCPHRCTFCACWRAAGGHVLVRSPEDVARELAALPTRAIVFFADDHTFADVRRAEELCSRIRSEGAARRYGGYTRADTIVKHPGLFERWRAVGLDGLTVGLEAVSDEKLAAMQKGTSAAVNEEAIRVLHRLGIIPSAQLLVDPDFDEGDFDSISEFVRRTNLGSPVFVVTTPLPGTDLYEQQRLRISMPYEYFDFLHPVVPPRLGLERFLARFVGLYHDAYSIRRNVRQRLQRAGMLPVPGGDRGSLPRPLSLPVLVGWHLLAGPLERRLRRQCRVGCAAGRTPWIQ